MFELKYENKKEARSHLEVSFLKKKHFSKQLFN